MKMVLIGHRGTGKTQLLERLKVYLRGFRSHSELAPASSQLLQFFDLDREIEFRSGTTIAQIFQEKGEAAFRELEVAVFQELISKNPEFIISLGAGFQLSAIPKGVERIWVRRKTDQLGRIFLNRPRLNPDLSPLEEYLKRLPLREERYQHHSDWQYIMPEGLEGPHAIEEKIFCGDFKDLGGILTLLPKHFENTDHLQSVLRTFEVEHFELRDDLLALSQIQLACSLLPHRRVLMSLRTPQTHPWIIEFLKLGVAWDWATELGPCSVKAPMAPIYSLHNLNPGSLSSLESLNRDIAGKKLESFSHLKLAPTVHNFQELKVLYDWFLEDPEHRSILPRSNENGIWAWFRLFMKFRQKMNFFRTDQGSAPDQPTLFEWLSQKQLVRDFAAVLGHPVFHSRTPMEHENFFAKRHMPVFAIDMDGVDFPESFRFLETLGLRAAAVTSPLKNAAYNLSPYRSALANDLGSVNTLVKKDQVWYSHNTDLDGFRALFSRVTSDKNQIVTWGGGGTLSVIRKIIPKTWSYSVRSLSLRKELDDQVPRSTEETLEIQRRGPDILIWAAAPDSPWPPENWRPKIIVDLNYREDSLAREYAMMVNAQYIDGLIMFQEQAKAQRDYWERN